jgi:hypothetical protein
MKKTIAIVLAATIMAGCATQPARTYVAKKDDPKLILKSTGMPMNVEYSISSSDVACENFENVGTVHDSGRDVLLPWIANLTEKLNRVPLQLESAVSANKQVQVKGYGKWYDSTSSGTCGPIVTLFTPSESRTYLVEFVWEGTVRCSSRVSDITNPSDKKAVPVEFKHCPRSFMSVLLKEAN